MKKSYEDYIAEMYECYQDYKIEDKFSTVESVAKTLYDFEGLMHRSETEKAVILITYGQLVVSEQSRVLDITKDSLVEKLNHIDFLLIKEEKKLSIEQYNDLQSNYISVLKNINEMQIDSCRMARWYYDELTQEIKQYYLTINDDSINAEKLINEILSRFKRDCKNTLSERMIVYTTLVEVLLNNDFKVPEEFYVEIKSFDVNEIKDQLLQAEKEELIKRIKIILERSNNK